MPKLKADVRAPELVHGNRELQQLGPAGAVAVVENEGVVFTGRGLSRAEGDEVLAERTGPLQTAPRKGDAEGGRATALRDLPAPQRALIPRAGLPRACSCKPAAADSPRGQSPGASWAEGGPR